MWHETDKVYRNKLYVRFLFIYFQLVIVAGSYAVIEKKHCKRVALL